ncbi:MAG: chromate transporter [Acidaminococcaceae bacterium]|jgi:chromate transporter|nr:chromate transporter [Acidaminococcaceae bacterium]
MNEMQKQPEQQPVTYWTLFKSTFLISAFTVGGGFVLIPLMKAKFVDEYHWINDKEALDLVAIAQSAPGAVAINAAIIMGYRMGKVKGLLTTLLGTVLPPLITLTIVSQFYTAFAANQYVQMVLKGMQCGVAAVILDVVLDLVLKQCRKKLLLPILIMFGSFVASYIFDINIMYIILVDAFIGLAFMQKPVYN